MQEKFIFVDDHLIRFQTTSNWTILKRKFLQPSNSRVINKANFTYKGSLRSHKTPLKGLRLMALPAFAEALDPDWLLLLCPAFWLAEAVDAAGLKWPAFSLGESPRGLLLFEGGPELLSSSDIVSSVSGFSFLCLFFWAPGPFVKFMGGGAGGGMPAPPSWWLGDMGDGVNPEGLSWTRLRLLEGNWPSRLSWSTNSLPAETENNNEILKQQQM